MSKASIKLTGNGIFESSRMMLPEHRQQFVTRSGLWQKGSRTRPVLDDQEMEEFAQKISESQHSGKEITLRVWGQEEVLTGIVMRIDAPLGRLVLAHSTGRMVIRIHDIIEVRS
ncbi:YolD-like family protein [Paenibacillus sp. GYB003]|uniref:YolD-like family protein n=1 Tax=Paenibacillus sp. GYB003 TaxID=2994392 RepID=UPI002F962097